MCVLHRLCSHCLQQALCWCQDKNVIPPDPSCLGADERIVAISGSEEAGSSGSAQDALFCCSMCLTAEAQPAVIRLLIPRIQVRPSGRCAWSLLEALLAALALAAHAACVAYVCQLLAL